MVQSSSGWPKNKDQPASTRLPKPKEVHKFFPRQEAHKYPNPKGFQCFKCQGWGHKANECPKRRNVILREGRLYYISEKVSLEKEENEAKPQDERNPKMSHMMMMFVRMIIRKKGSAWFQTL